MSSFTMKLPDVGEGVAEAEIVEWLVAVGDEVTPDSPIAEVLTDKATVEISAPVTGTVAMLHGEPGDVLAVGADLVEIETQGDIEAVPEAEVEAKTEAQIEADAPTGASEPAAPAVTESDASGDTSPVVVETSSPALEPTADSDRPKPTAAPAVRARAKELGIDLAEVDGTGPDGRIVHADLDRVRGGSRLARSTRGSESSGAATVSGAGTPHAVRGVRRRIAERLTSAWTEIPHITYVDAVDVTEVERLRRELNDAADADAQRLTLLPFLATAIVVAVRDHSGVNAHYDHAAETLTTFDAVHVGVATQTDDGLRVPVVRHAESHDLRSLADEIARVTEAARTGNATRDELTGSTITITSLGALGGIVTTPILNPPEVAIVGVNKIETRPVWEDGTWVPRQMMNLSSSFDHRMVDGWDAAVFVQRLKQLLQSPALLFIDE